MSDARALQGMRLAVLRRGVWAVSAPAWSERWDHEGFYDPPEWDPMRDPCQPEYGKHWDRCECEPSEEPEE
jgi:hypothetical protein